MSLKQRESTAVGVEGEGAEEQQGDKRGVELEEGQLARRGEEEGSEPRQ